MKKLIFTFFNYSKHSSKLLYKIKLDDWEKYFIPKDLATNRLLTKIKDNDLIIGIADHNKNAKQTRLDLKYINKYGKKEIVKDDVEYLESNIKMDHIDNTYIYKSTTNGPCNRVSYLIINEINKVKLNTKYCFIHIKKKTTESEMLSILNSINV